MLSMVTATTSPRLAALARPLPLLGDVIEGRVSFTSPEGLWVDIGHRSPVLLPQAEVELFQLQDIAVGDDLEGLRVTALAGDGQACLLSLSEEGNVADAGLVVNSCSHATIDFRYTREMLIIIRCSSHGVASEDLEARAMVPIAAPRPQEELDPSLVDLAMAGQLPPPWWGRCSLAAKRQALLIALREAHMHVVFAMQPESEPFRAKLQCVDLDLDLLQEAMLQVCTSTCKASTAVVSWLLEHGASAAPLLPPDRPSARRAGLRLLSEIGPAALAAVPAVLSCADDGDPRIRCAVFELLGRIGAAAAAVGVVDVVARSMLDRAEDPRVRQAAAKALGCLGDEGLSVAEGVLLHTDTQTRGLAALALGAAGGAAAPYGANALTCWLGGQTAEAQVEAAPLRLAAAEALGSMGVAAGTAAAAALAKMLREDVDEHVREACAVALGQLGSAGLAEFEAIVSALDDDDPFVQRAAAAALESVAAQAAPKGELDA